MPRSRNPSPSCSHFFAIEVVNTGDLVGLTATGADFAASPGGYKYDSSTGKIIFNVFGEDGR